MSVILSCFSTSAFKLLPGKLPAGTPKSEFQRAARVTSVGWCSLTEQSPSYSAQLDVNRRHFCSIFIALWAMRDSSPSKLTLWMEYSFADSDKR
jgi:hypothetical protein